MTIIIVILILLAVWYFQPADVWSGYYYNERDMIIIKKSGFTIESQRGDILNISGKQMAWNERMIWKLEGDTLTVIPKNSSVKPDIYIRGPADIWSGVWYLSGDDTLNLARINIDTVRNNHKDEHKIVAGRLLWPGGYMINTGRKLDYYVEDKLVRSYLKL